jgi:DNA polymerase-3 subunit delta'
MTHHAYVIAGESDAGIQTALKTIKKELGMTALANPDVIVQRYGLLAVEDVRRIIALAQQSPIGGDHKALIIAASRIYHEAQNALLKLFEEPPQGTVLFLIIPELGQLLPTLRSRVAVLQSSEVGGSGLTESVADFLHASREGRSAIIKKLTSGTDEEERRALREEALALVNGIEQAAYRQWGREPSTTALLADISILRGYLYDRSAPVKMILEHLALTISKGLAK